MDKLSSPQPDVSGCLMKITVCVMSVIVLAIFFIGLVAGVVIANGM